MDEEMMEEDIQSFVPGNSLWTIKVHVFHEDFTEFVEFGLVSCSNIVMVLRQFLNFIPILLDNSIIDNVEDLGGMSFEVSIVFQVSHINISEFGEVSLDFWIFEQEFVENVDSSYCSIGCMVLGPGGLHHMSFIFSQLDSSRHEADQQCSEQKAEHF